MRSTLPLLSRTQPAAPSTATPPQPVPTIRLISATPSMTADASTSFSAVAPFASSPLAPRADSEAPRKRLVLKKSKLGLLGSGKTKERVNKDLSDVVRRIGGTTSTGRSGFEIYVDHNEDPEIGEIVVVKKKKSRLGLDGMTWGALGEVTNIPAAKEQKPKPAPVENLLKVKGDENQKWWSIGRGRKDSKEKAKAKESERQKSQVRSKTPEPLKSLDTRAQFNSLDSGIVLSGSASQERLRQPSPTSIPSRAPSPLTAGATLSAVPSDSSRATNGLLAPEPPASGSIALRAIRSMRSLARMASWAQLTNTNNDINEAARATAPSKTKAKEKEKEAKEKGEGKKKKKKEKEKEAKKKTIRSSGSSFEAGALSAQESPRTVKQESPVRTLRHTKQSVLGLGLPSTLRMSTVRQVSTASSSCAAQPPASNRLSVDSAHLILNANGRPSSVLSSGSSLCPPSTISGGSVISGRSGRSSSSSVVSVRWDEECIRSSKELQRKERRSRREQEGGNTRRESRKTSDARKRTPISEIFPEMQIERPVPISPPRSTRQPPMVTVEEATADGHSEASLTPVKRARPRPMSEQLLGKARPQAVCESQEGDGVLSILDAVTNDLASLINRLDLEATPSSTSNISPLRQTPRAIAGDDSPLRKRTIRDSPLKAELRESKASISSLRPYACTQETANQKSVVKQMIGQSIAPWSTFDWHVSPRKEPTRTVAKARPTHKRTLTPSPAVEPPVFQPLRPAKVKTTNALVTSPSPVATTPLLNCAEPGEPSSGTFGLRSSKHKLRASVDSPTASPTPVFKRTTGLHRKSSSLLAVKSKQSHHSLGNSGIPISPEARMGLGLAGTMGGSGSTEPPVDPEDPDSDIPDELQVILSGQSDEEGERCLDDTLSFRRVSCPTSPREVPLPLPEVPQLSESVETVDAVEVVADAPVFCAQLLDEDANQADIDDGGNGSSEDDTNKSFDFTGELQKLNESGGSDRRSFVEQLENAFRTPARIELGYGLGEHLGLNHNFLAVPPVPALPSAFRHSPAEDVAPRSVSQPGVELSLDEEVPGGLAYGDSMVSAEAQFSIDHVEDHCRVYPELRKSISMRSKASDGQLNVDFKFGGKPDIPDTLEERSERPLTLSDIIPPPEVAYCLSQTSLIEEDSSVLKSIMAQASDLPPPVPRPVPRMRLDSDSSSKRHARDAVLVSRSADSQPAHSRNPSDASFVGFDSFDEIRRGFEFGPDRPTFYPPPGAVSRPTHGRGESVFSIASVSSYGAALNSGALDPFGFGPSRPPSEVSMSVSMSMSVDDTFSFMHRGRNRPRVDSDASSFYFHAPGPAQASLPCRRGHRRHESALSVASNAPPVSLYNRSFGVHKRNDSNTSASSMAQSYAVHGANGGRAAWARHHRQDASVDSQFSDFSAQRLGRPGLGDKMFDNDYGMPLSAISASPPGSVAEDKLSRRASWDSVLDGGKRSSMDDSLFEKVEDRTSMSSDSVFGYDGRYAYARELPLSQFRPLSVMSEVSTHSPRKEDDTMVTMLDGDHIRRRSLSSMIEASPCTRVERRKPAVGHVRPAAPLFEPIESPLVDSPKVRLAEKPSIASTSSYQFGGERMIMARKGLLERQSLEDSALIAQGEDLLESLRSRSMFSRPDPASRSRSSTCTSSGAETPPLSLSDGSSQSSGSQSSIDLSHLSTLLSTATHPSSGVARVRARARARGTGHRRRISQARASRSSVYETILEEASVAGSPSPAKSLALSSIMSMSPGPVGDSIIVVDGDNDSISKWDDERGIVTLRKYYALRDEAHDTVTESKRTWSDTPFSVFAVQSFRPPNNRGGMQAMLEHSQKNYGSLPSELRLHRIRSRTSSRASPYPLRSVRSSVSPSMSPEQSWPSSAELHVELSVPKELLPPVPPVPSVLREVHVDANTMSPPPAIQPPKPFTPFAIDFDTSKMGKSNLGLPAHPRPRVTSSARRTALGWSKRSTGKSSSNDQKENISQSMVITPSETLRINRPRPRGRPMSARVPVPTA